MPDRVETNLGRPEQIFGEVAYYLVQELALPHSIAAAWGPYADLHEFPKLTRNQLRLYAYCRYVLTASVHLVLSESEDQRDLLDDGEPGSGYRGFHRFFDLAVALEAHKRGDEALFGLALANARRGLAYDALFAVEHEGRIKTLPPGIRCGTEPMGLWCVLEIICDGAVRGNLWPGWRWNNHRPVLPALALLVLTAKRVEVFSTREWDAIRSWIIDRKWTDTFAGLLAGVRTRYPVIVLIDKGRLWSSFTQSIAKADNIRFEVALSPGNVHTLQAHRDGVDFYGDAVHLSEGLMEFRGRLHHKKEGRWEDVLQEYPVRGPWPDADQEIRIDHRGIILNGKPIEGGAVPPPEPEPREPNWEVAARQIDAARAALITAGLKVQGERARDAILYLDSEGKAPGAMQHLRRALAALKGEI